MMSRPVSLAITCLTLALACTSESKDPKSNESDAKAPAPAEPAPTDPGPLPDAPTFKSGPFEVCYHAKDSKEACKPLRPTEVFVHEDGPDMIHHSMRFGWTADNSAFAYCWPDQPFCEGCTFTTPDGKIEKLIVRTSEECTDEGTEVTATELEQRLKDRGVAMRDGEWPYGGELLVSYRSVEGKPFGDNQPRAGVEVGAILRDGSSEGIAYTDDACTKTEEGDQCFIDAHAEAIALSPDGKHVAILAHMWYGEWGDNHFVKIMPAGHLAGSLYNHQGFDALKREDFKAAADAFLKLMHADPTEWKGPYNLACAYARGGDPRVETALKAAVERGGDAVRKKAGKDKDLDSVRSQDWFTALIGDGK